MRPVHFGAVGHDNAHKILVVVIKQLYIRIYYTYTMLTLC